MTFPFLIQAGWYEMLKISIKWYSKGGIHQESPLGEGDYQYFGTEKVCKAVAKTLD